MERYEEYKDSGVEWIGEIPAGWEIGRFGKAGISSLGKMLANNPDADDSFLAPYLKAANVQESGFELGDIAEMYFNSHDEGRYRIKRGDLLVVEGGSVGVSQIWDGSIEPCYIQNALHRVRPSEGFEARYLKFCLDLARYSGYVDLICNKATIAHFTKEKLSATPIPIPSFCEQKAIADYLESETAEISSVIADCEREVELLQEYRKAVISEAVTKGLDPNVPMKDSGIEWIGEIPEVWIVRPAKSLFTESKVLRLSSDERCTVSQKYGVIPQSQFTALENQRTVLADKNLESWKHVSPGDFVISLRSFQGGIEFCRVSGCVTWHYIVLKGQPDADNGYFRHLFKSKGYIEALQRTCTYIRDGQDLRYSNFIQVSLPLPPLSEQHAIATYLDKKTTEIDAIIAGYQSMADKLREYRKSLISEAVTGKFKVPGV